MCIVYVKADHYYPASKTPFILRFPYVLIVARDSWDAATDWFSHLKAQLIHNFNQSTQLSTCPLSIFFQDIWESSLFRWTFVCIPCQLYQWMCEETEQGSCTTGKVYLAIDCDPGRYHITMQSLYNTLYYNTDLDITQPCLQILLSMEFYKGIIGNGHFLITLL